MLGLLKYWRASRAATPTKPPQSAHSWCYYTAKVVSAVCSPLTVGIYSIERLERWLDRFWLLPEVICHAGFNVLLHFLQLGFHFKLWIASSQEALDILPNE